jgi:hypothetical protein
MPESKSLLRQMGGGIKKGNKWGSNEQYRVDSNAKNPCSDRMLFLPSLSAARLRVKE